jgi:hypothetical protein
MVSPKKGEMFRMIRSKEKKNRFFLIEYISEVDRIGREKFGYL